MSKTSKCLKLQYVIYRYSARPGHGHGQWCLHAIRVSFHCKCHIHVASSRYRDFLDSHANTTPTRAESFAFGGFCSMEHRIIRPEC